MTSSPKGSNSPDDDSGLSPEQERIVGRVRMQSVVSAGIMILSVLLVLSAIIYKFVNPPEGSFLPEGVEGLASLDMPAGGQVSATTIDGDRLVLTITHDSGTQVVIYNLNNFSKLGTIDLK